MRVLARWYVYELVDPRDGKTFYIGKGTGSRLHNHEIEASKGVCSAKCQKIREITNSGLSIIKRKIAEFWDESAAYKCEAERIAEDWEFLTNQQPGGYGGISGNGYQRAKPMTPDSALNALQRRIDLVAHYLIATDGGKKKVRVEISGNVHKVWKTVWEGFLNLAYNHLYRECINEVSKSDKAWLSLTESLLPYGVRLENGCQN